MAKCTLKDIPLSIQRDLDYVIETLVTLRSNAKQGKYADSNSGICYTWWDENWRDGWKISDAQFISMLAEIAKDWPQSRRPGFFTVMPVPDIQGLMRWQGKNLELRLSLINYILKRLRDWRRRMPKEN